jgi:hypothetical protein
VLSDNHDRSFQILIQLGNWVTWHVPRTTAPMVNDICGGLTSDSDSWDSDSLWPFRNELL